MIFSAALPSNLSELLSSFDVTSCQQHLMSNRPPDCRYSNRPGHLSSIEDMFPWCGRTYRSRIELARASLGRAASRQRPGRSEDCLNLLKKQQTMPAITDGMKYR
ncbi:hypothetical protein RRG08_032693 [Elysia crispata]|uniref:Uncharacterized protein n=1 Tax=Elysia crispata TaxID=231223 RepID=A0AAE0YVA4_9GAST|nr:hypothetical protein RRG08_032693 [Elysia crispata]